jgi:4-hydroxy-tetrahydrodipicolinate synthase
MSADLLTKLLESGFFAGIKDSSGDWEIFTALKELHGRLPFQLLVGHDRMYARALQEGTDGLVSGAAAAIPELVVAIQKSGGTQNDLIARLDEFLDWVDQFPATVVIKEAAEARRWVQSTVALPLSQHTEQRLAEFRTWFSGWLPGTLEACSVRT